MTLWQGRFGDEGPADELLAYSVSVTFDRRLAPDDIAGSAKEEYANMDGWIVLNTRHCSSTTTQGALTQDRWDSDPID